MNNYEYVNHPSHYNNYSMEVIDMMENIWGTEKTALWCEMTAFKYRMRMGTKPDNSIQQDIDKEKWYLNKSKSLYSSLKNIKPVVITNMDLNNITPVKENPDKKSCNDKISTNDYHNPWQFYTTSTNKELSDE